MLRKNEWKGTYDIKKVGELPYKFQDDSEYILKTPLVKHEGLAKRLGVKAVYIKDEGKRIELKSFKILGVSWAVEQYLKKHKDSVNEKTVFCACTDGNHGRALAYVCNKLKKKCVIYVPAGTSIGRIEAIAKYNAKVIVTKVDYDATMEMVDKDAKINGWTNISDNSYGEEDSEIPRYIMQGYSGIFREANEQIKEDKDKFTHAFVQAGVGCLAGSAGWYFAGIEEKDRPMLICVEPTDADCYMESAKNGGKLSKAKGKLESLMNGLNCGLPSYASFKWVLNNYSYMMTIEDDEEVKEEMRYMHKNEPKMITGESGVAGIAATVICANKKEWKKELGLDENSVILCVNTEGATDEELFQKIIEKKM